MFFRKKVEVVEKSQNVLEIEELAEVAPTGSTFVYMGVTCTVLSHYYRQYYPHLGRSKAYPRLGYEYVDNAGVIQSGYLTYTQFMAIRERSFTAIP